MTRGLICRISATQRGRPLQAREMLADAIKVGKPKVLPEAFVVVDELGRTVIECPSPTDCRSR
jgi:hypothetical protein